MDSTTTQQIPNISIFNQDIVRVELYTPDLKGLAFRDLELAGIIDSFDLEKYHLVPLEKEKGYKRIIRMAKLEKDNASIGDEIAQMAGGSRFKNKFKITDHEKNFNQNNM